MRKTTFAAVLLIAASAFAGEERHMAKAVADADWSKMETVSVTMTEYAFSPSRVLMKAGTPTRLVLRNEGKEHHYFVAERFFGTVATRKVQGSDGEVKAPFLTAVEVYAGKTLEWFLIPTEKGTFGLVCTVRGHADHGMKGTIEVR